MNARELVALRLQAVNSWIGGASPEGWLNEADRLLSALSEAGYEVVRLEKVPATPIGLSSAMVAGREPLYRKIPEETE